MAVSFTKLRFRTILSFFFFWRDEATNTWHLSGILIYKFGFILQLGVLWVSYSLTFSLSVPQKYFSTQNITKQNVRKKSRLKKMAFNHDKKLFRCTLQALTWPDMDYNPSQNGGEWIGSKWYRIEVGREKSVGARAVWSVIRNCARTEPTGADWHNKHLQLRTFIPYLLHICW